MREYKLILSHPLGNTNVRAILNSLSDHQLLHSFHTGIAVFPNTTCYALSNLPLLNEIQRRSYKLKFKDQTRTWPWQEISRLLALKLGFRSLVKHEHGIFSVDSIFKGLDNKVSTQLNNVNIKGVYAYEDGALETFTRAKELGIQCIYDLPIAYWETGRRLMQEEAERLPHWAPTLAGGIKDSAIKLKRKTRELELADVVVVPSHFVKNSLPTSAANKHVILSHFGSPMGSDVSDINVKDYNRPLRVLFVGSMGQRKGLADLFEAVKMLNTKQIELVVLGSLLADLDFYRSEYKAFTYEKGRSHQEVLELMRSCDVFCLPSIVEGRALVIQEAMSQGLPIIITPNTGGEDLVIEGETGFLVPIRSPEKIAEKLNWFLENRNQIHQMSQEVRVHAKKYTWETYGNQIVNYLMEKVLV